MNIETVVAAYVPSAPEHPDMSIFDLGADSLDIRGISKDLGDTIAVQDIMIHNTLNKLKEFVSK